MIVKSQEFEERTMGMVAELMCTAARTAPKARGVDNLVAMIVKARLKDQIAEEMRRIAKESNVKFFERDADCLDRGPMLVLLGQKVKPIGVNPCGYCGFNGCDENSKNGGACAISVGDLGIAIGAAVSIAADNRIDNRVMFSIGKAALNLNVFEEEVTIAYGIPLSIAGKNPFFDRG